MSFVATHPLSRTATDTIVNLPFFPDVDLLALRDVIRLDGTVTNARLRHATVDAIASVNIELRTWRGGQENTGHVRLADVPADTLDGHSVLLHHYLRAVYCTAKANLIERYRDFDATAEGHKRADDQDPQSDDLRRDARWSISEILGLPRTTIELI